MIDVATLEDVPRLVELGAMLHVASSYRTIPYSSRKVETLLESLISGDGVVFVARDSAGVVIGGLAGGIAQFWFSDEPHGYEYSFFVEPTRRHGLIAMKLIEAFTIWCGRRGARVVRMGITTGIQEEGTSRLFEFMGFRRIGTLFERDTHHGD